jgi:hypothetical protein
MATSKKSPQWGDVIKKGALAGIGAASVGIIQKQIPAEYQKYSSFVPVVGGAVLMKQPNEMVQLIGLGMFASGVSAIAQEKMPELFGNTVNGAVNGAIQARRDNEMLSEREIDEMEMAVALSMDEMNGLDDDDDDDDEDEMNGLDDDEDDDDEY